MSSEDLIKQLRSRAIAARGTDFISAADDLQTALKSHIESMRAMAAAALLLPPVSPTDLPDAARHE